jgi:UDP-N-acetylmuramyl pentapeptide phosphotransferase/UDP-N-acetylglucosamine-1-phosphate transferase
MLIAISTSIILFAALSKSFIFMLLPALGLTIIAMVFLVNVLNFYDGADLNLISIFFLLGLINLFADSSNSSYPIVIGSFLLAFSLSFSIFNCRPKVLYLGDCGSFVLASIFIYILITSIFQLISWPFEIIPLLAFPSFDVIYVLAIRCHCKHDLLSRNHLHLYQRLQIQYKNYFYLFPCVLNLLLSAALIKLFCLVFNNSFLVASVVSMVITPTTYLYFRHRFVEASYFFGDGK